MAVVPASTGTAPPRPCFSWPAARDKARCRRMSRSAAPLRASIARMPSFCWTSAARETPSPHHAFIRRTGRSRWIRCRRCGRPLSTAWANSGDAVRFYTTSVAVRDLDEVRAALGFQQIDLYGGSYGTRVAELYMRRYPAPVHAVILDGVTYPHRPLAPRPRRTRARLESDHCALPAVARLRRRLSALADELKALLTQYGPQKAR